MKWCVMLLYHDMRESTEEELFGKRRHISREREREKEVKQETGMVFVLGVDVFAKIK